MVAEIILRRAVKADIPLLARHHRLMFEEMRALSGVTIPKDSCCSAPDCCVNVPLSRKGNQNTALDFEQLETAQRAKLDEQLPDGSCVAWIAEFRGNPVASGAVSILKTAPVPEDPLFTVGFLHSMYTEQSLRGRGIASSIIDRLLDHCRKKGLKRVLLNASEAGRTIYRGKGFKEMNEAMRLWL